MVLLVLTTLIIILFFKKKVWEKKEIVCISTALFTFTISHFVRSLPKCLTYQKQTVGETVSHWHCPLVYSPGS